MAEVPLHAMQTILIIATTPSYAKKVRLPTPPSNFIVNETAVCVSSLMISEIKRIIKDSEIMKEDDEKWPQKNKDGRQELEIRLGNEHISFEVSYITSLKLLCALLTRCAYRRRRLVHSLMSLSLRIQKACESSTIWYRTSKHLFFH
jgi:hypothetical protein